jgi:hypothetical protein
LDTNSKTISAGEFSTNVANTRVLTLGSTVMNLTGYSPGAGNFRHFRGGQAGGLTVTANTSTVNLFKKTGLNTIFVTDAIDWNGLSIVFNGGALANMGGVAGTVKNITVNGAAFVDVADDSFMLNDNLTITGVLTLNGYSTSRRLKVISSSGGSQRTITVPNGTSVTGKNLSFNDISLSISTDLSAILGGSVNAGNNNNITFTTWVPGRYWVGSGSSNTWVATGPTNWADETGATDATVPTTTTNVFFDGNSGSSNSVLGANITIRSLNMTGYTGTLIHNSAVNLSIGDATAGTSNIALKLAPGMTYTLGDNATSAITFTSTSATVQTIDWGGKTSGNVTFNATSNGSWQYLSDHTFSSIATLNLTKGTLDTNDNTLNGAFLISDNGNIRTITLGNSTINLTGKSFQYVDFDTLANLTVTANTATINIIRNSGANAFCYMGFQAKDWNGLSINFTGGGFGVLENGNGSIFRNITYTGAVNSNNYEDVFRIKNLNTIISNSLTLNGYSASRRMKMYADQGKTIDVSTATVSGQYCDFYDVNFTTLKDLSAMTGGSGDARSNSNITFTPAITCYWKTSTGGTQQWNNVNNWYLGTNGTGGQARIPLPQDDVRFDGNSINAANTIVNVNTDVLRVGKNIDWTGVLNNPVWHFEPVANSLGIVFGSSVSCFGSLTLDPGMTMTSAKPNASFNMLGSGTGQAFTLKTCGVLIPQEEFLVYLSPTNTLTLTDAFNGNALNTTLFKTSSNYNFHSADVVGTVDFNGQDVTIGRLQQETTGTIALNSSTIKLTGVGTVWSCNGTINPNTSTIELNNNTTGTQTFAGNNKIYNNIKISGLGVSYYTFSGNNTFTDFTDVKTVAHNLTFTASSNTTFTGTISVIGSAGNPVSLTSSTTTAFTWTKTTGTVNCDYLILTKSTAAGGATFNPGANSVDGGGNTGWSAFTVQPYTWLGGTGNWNTGANWQGGSVPGVSDTAYFNATSVANCSLDASVNCYGINVGLNYTGTITQASALIIGAGGIEIKGGTFTGATQSITNGGSFKQTGGIFTDTSGTHEVTAAGTIADTWLVNAGTHTHNSGTIKISGTLAAIVNNTSARQFQHLEINTSGVVSGTFFVDGNLTRTLGTTLDADISLKGNYLPLAGGSSSAGTGIVRFTAGVAGQSFSYPYAPSVQVNLSGGGVLNIPNNVQIGGDWNQTAGTITWNNNKATFDNTNAVTSIITTGSFYDIEISKNALYSVVLSGVCTIGNNLTITSLANLNSLTVTTPASSYFNVNGNLVTNSTSWGGTSKIFFKGATTNTFTGTGKLGVEAEISKLGGSLELYANLDMPNSGHDLVVRSGNLDLRGFNLTVNDTLTIFGTMTLKGSETISVNNLTTPSVTNPNFTISATSSTIIYSDSAVTANVTSLGKTFYHLIFGASKTHEINTGVGNGITVNGALGSNGTSGTRSILRSAANASVDWKLTLNGTSALANKVIVKRSDASAGLGVLAVGSLSAGNNTNWVGLIAMPSISSVSSSKANGSYGIGEVISIQVTFDVAVTVTGTPTLTLETGTVDRVINYNSGSGSTTLTFSYTVQSGDNTSDLDYTSTTALALNSGTIKNGGTDASLDLPTPGAANSLGANKAIAIDTTPSVVTSVSSSTANGTYKTGDVISVSVTFSKVVIVTNTPTITLETGTTDQNAAYTSGSGSTILVFNYTVQAGDTSSDLDYVTTTSLALAGGTIKDGASNNATLTLASPGAVNSLGANKAIVIDTTVPTVTSVSSSTANGTYKIGSVIAITVAFSESVIVTNTPTITLETGTTDQTASYASGSGSNSLVFNYTVQAGDVSADLDYTSTTALALSGGTITDVALNNATLTLAAPAATNSLGANKALVIDGVVPTIQSQSLGSSNAYIDITFSEAIYSTNGGSGGLDAADFSIAFAANSGTATNATISSVTTTSNASTAGGETTVRLVLVVTGAVSGAETITITPVASSIFDLAGNPAAISTSTGAVVLSASAGPTITNVTSSKTDGSYKQGDIIMIQVVFSTAVIVTGTPTLTLETGATDQIASYSSGTGSATLEFTYTVQSGDSSSDLDYTSTTALSLNSGSIKNAGSIDATLVLPTSGAAGSLGANKALVIDGVAPTIQSSSLGALNAYLDITFSEAIYNSISATGGVDSTDFSLAFAANSGTATGVSIVSVKTTADSVTVGGEVSVRIMLLISGTVSGTETITITPVASSIFDALGNPALNTTSTGAVTLQSGPGPTVTNVSSSTADGSYKKDSLLSIEVTFSEIVNVTGTPVLTLETGSTDQNATYASGSGSTTLIFQYTVQSGDTSSDLDYVGTGSLGLSGGTIKNAGGTNATLVLPSPGASGSLGGNKSLIIDTTAPTVTSVSSSTANGAYITGDAIVITVTFSEAVIVTGTPTLTLETGTTDRTVSFTSGSGTTTLSFAYTVQSGDFSNDLDYASTSSLIFAGGSITDAALNSSVLTLASPGGSNSLGANKSFTINSTTPIVTSVSSSATNGAYKAGAVLPITITFSQAVTVTGVPTLTLETGVTDRVISNASGSGSTVLVFNYTVQAGDTSSDLGYTSTSALSLAGGTIKNTSGEDAILTLNSPGSSESLSGSKSIVIDTTVPSIATQSLDSNLEYIDISFSEAVYTSSGSGAVVPSDFVVSFAKNGGTATGVTISSVKTILGSSAVGGETTLRLYLTIAGDVVGTETFSIAPAASEIFDIAGNPASVIPATPSFTIKDETGPVVVNVTSSKDNGTYKAGVTIEIQVVFSEKVTVTGTPILTLETGTIDQIVNYTSGSGSTTLIFSYAIQSGDSSSALDYQSTTALALNDGTIKDAKSNVANLSLPVVGASGSLSGNKSIKIDTTAPTITAVVIDSKNEFVDVTFSEGVYTTAGSGVILPTDFGIEFSANGGTASGVTITSILSTSEEPLVGGEKTIRIFIFVDGTVSGKETIILKALADSIFDVAGNALAEKEVSGTLTKLISDATGGGGGGGGCQYAPHATLKNGSEFLFLFFTLFIFGIRRKIKYFFVR